MNSLLACMLLVVLAAAVIKGDDDGSGQHIDSPALADKPEDKEGEEEVEIEGDDNVDELHAERSAAIGTETLTPEQLISLMEVSGFILFEALNDQCPAELTIEKILELTITQLKKQEAVITEQMLPVTTQVKAYETSCPHEVSEAETTTSVTYTDPGLTDEQKNEVAEVRFKMTLDDFIDAMPGVVKSMAFIFNPEQCGSDDIIDKTCLLFGVDKSKIPKEKLVEMEKNFAAIHEMFRSCKVRISKGTVEGTVEGVTEGVAALDVEEKKPEE